MSLLQIGHWLEDVSIEQLPGVVAVSTLLCLACLLITRLLRHRSASTTSGVWQATCSAILVSVLVLVLIPGVPLQSHSTAQRVDVTAVSRSTWQAMTAQVAQQGTAKDDDPVLNQALDVGLKTDGSYRSTIGTVTSEEASGDAISVAPLAREFRFAESLAAAWLFVLVVMMAGFLRSVITCRTIIKKSSKNIPSHISEAAGTACLRLGISQVPQLHLSNEVLVPFTAGTLRPVIVLPLAAIEWSREKLQMVMTHELAHIERRDVLWHWIARLAICVAWFNPLVWWAARRGGLDRERACDDRVIGCGFQGPDYSQCLVEIAAAVSGRIMPVTAAVSMAEPPMKLRLQSILSTDADRRRESKSYRGFVMATFVGLAVLLGIVRPLATAPAASSIEANQITNPTSVVEQPAVEVKPADSKPAIPSNPEASLIEIAKPVTGLITDEAGTPIAGVSVLVKLRDFGGVTPQPFRTITIGSWQATTDESGRYTIDISNIGKQPSRYDIGVEAADKPGFVQGHSSYWPSLKDVAAGKELRTMKLSRGRRVTGQVLAENGQPCSAIVKAFAKTQSNDHWSYSGQQIGADGKLEIDLPVDSEVQLVLYADNHSPMSVSVSPDQSDLGRVQLSRGSVVSGSVIDQKSNPVKGVIVELKSPNHLWSRVAVTNETGAFRMLPAAGKCGLSVQESVQMRDQISGYESLTGVRPPLIMPVELSLSAERVSQQIELTELQSFRISGTARWDDGEPASNVEIAGGIFVGGLGIELTTVVTDAKGHYELSLPQNSLAYVSGAAGAYRNGDREVWYKSTGPSSTGSSQIVSIEKLTGDMEYVNWELRPYREAPRKTSAQKRAEQAYAALEAEDQKQIVLYNAAPPKDKYRLDPRHVMAAKYLEFEEEFRGENEAVQAAVHVLRSGNGVYDPGSAIAKARAEMVERLINNYIGHEDLIDAFGSLNYGPPVPRANDLLRFASARSPHPIVRAAALLARAERAKVLLRALPTLPEQERHVAMMKDSSSLYDVRSTPDTIEGLAEFEIRMADSAQQRLDELKAIDEADLRTQAGRWLDAIEKDYADLIRPHTFEHTFGQDAKALRFAIDHVNDGQPAPDIEATDVNGKLFRLSDQLGKVVVVIFQQDHTNTAVNLPHQNLGEQFKEQPLELVTIMATGEQGAFVENAKATSYHGTLIWEPFRGPFRSNWGVTGYPTTWIVDKAGRLSTSPLGGSDISETIETLLKE